MNGNTNGTGTSATFGSNYQDYSDHNFDTDKIFGPFNLTTDGKNLFIPDSYNGGIRAINGGGIDSGNGGIGGGTGVNYSGPYAQDVSYLQAHSPTPFSATAPPRIGSLPCMRDTYVASALWSAWAVTQHAAKGDTVQAEVEATYVHNDLRKATDLCSPGAPTVAGGSACSTEDIWPCPAPFQP